MNNPFVKIKPLFDKGTQYHCERCSEPISTKRTLFYLCATCTKLVELQLKKDMNELSTSTT